METAGPLHLVAIVANEIDRFFDLANRFEPRFADLDQAGDGNFPFAPLDLVRSGAQYSDAAGPAKAPPCRIGRASRDHRLVDLRCARLRELAENNFAIDRAQCLDDRPFIAVAPADKCRLALT